MRERKTEEKFKERGITLIALIITIIVLLILAVVAISAVQDDGIINYAKKSKEDTQIAQEKEIIKLARSEVMIEEAIGKITDKDIPKALNELLKNEKAIARENGDTIVITFEKSERSYSLDKNGNIEIFTPYVDTTPGKLAKNSDGKYMIESIEDLVVFSAMANGGYSDENIEIIRGDWINAVLMCDLDFKSPLSYSNSETTLYNGYLGVEDENVPLIEALTNIEKYKGFTPIGNYEIPFKGTFNGENHFIKNLCVNTGDYAGLFGCVTIYATDTIIIRDVKVTGDIRSTSMAGGIVAAVYAKKSGNIISNCTNYANVSGSLAGGIVGFFQECDITITSCANHGNIVGNENAGGILGKSKESAGVANMKYCMNFGKVLGQNAGGMLGYGDSNIYSCCSMPTSVVSTFEGKGNAGGMVGRSYVTANIYNSMNLGIVTAGVNARTVLLE